MNRHKNRQSINDTRQCQAIAVSYSFQFFQKMDSRHFQNKRSVRIVTSESRDSSKRYEIWFFLRLVSCRGCKSRNDYISNDVSLSVHPNNEGKLDRIEKRRR